MQAEFPIDRLVFDEQLWPRLRRDENRVAYFAELLDYAVQQLPPVKICDSGLVLSGWHTVAAYQLLKRTMVPVEVVDVPEADRLLYAYREDVAAALPYTSDDVRSVARRLYQQRSNGHPVNVADLARDLGRAQQTVFRWVRDLVEADTERERVGHQARMIANHAFRFGANCPVRRIAELLGASYQSVFRDTQVSIAEHLTDSRIVSAAQSLIHLAIGHGATQDEADWARDWLLAQTQPDLLHAATINRALNQIDSDLHRALEFLDRAAGLECPELQPSSDTINQWRDAILSKLEEAMNRLGNIRKKVADDEGQP